MDRIGFLRDITGWNSHRRLLFVALELALGRNRMELVCERPAIVECGIGFGSTVVLHDFAVAYGWDLWSLDNDPEWLNRFWMLAGPRHHFIPPAHTQNIPEWQSMIGEALDRIRLGGGSPVFALVDQAPAEARSPAIDQLREAGLPLIVVHDTEPQSEHGYKMADAMGRFRFRRDDANTGTWTTLLSDTIDVSGLPLPAIPTLEVP